MPKRILGPELNSCFPGKKLWHLFSWEERYKLETFLDGALWCSDVGSIIGFDGDAEGSRFCGIFISCWHVNVGDPSENVWDVFGGGGNGFAIRTSTERLKAIADAILHSSLTSSTRLLRKCGARSWINLLSSRLQKLAGRSYRHSTRSSIAAGAM
jgi:hypothetical protein